MEPEIKTVRGTDFMVVYKNNGDHQYRCLRCGAILKRERTLETHGGTPSCEQGLKHRQRTGYTVVHNSLLFDGLVVYR
jgi:uncharacterized C2H2 Zn-finger protein